jgi:hypothetical protein
MAEAKNTAQLRNIIAQHRKSTDAIMYFWMDIAERTQEVAVDLVAAGVSQDSADEIGKRLYKQADMIAQAMDAVGLQLFSILTTIDDGEQFKRKALAARRDAQGGSFRID